MEEPELTADTDFVVVADNEECGKLFTPRLAPNQDLVPFETLLQNLSKSSSNKGSANGNGVTDSTDFQGELKLWDLESDEDFETEDESCADLSARDGTSGLGEFSLRSGAMSRLDAATRLELELAELGILGEQRPNSNREPIDRSGAISRLDIAHKNALATPGSNKFTANEREREIPTPTNDKSPGCTASSDINDASTRMTYLPGEFTDCETSRTGNLSPGGVTITNSAPLQTVESTQCSNESESTKAHNVALNDPACDMGRKAINSDEHLANSGITIPVKETASTLGQQPDITRQPVSGDGESIELETHFQVPSNSKTSFVNADPPVIDMTRYEDMNELGESGTRESHLSLTDDQGNHGDPTSPVSAATPLACPCPPTGHDGQPAPGAAGADRRASHAHSYIDWINKSAAIDRSPASSVQVNSTVNTGSGSNKAESGAAHRQKHRRPSTGGRTPTTPTAGKSLSKSFNETVLRKSSSQGRERKATSERETGKSSRQEKSTTGLTTKDGRNMTVWGMDSCVVSQRPKSSKGRPRARETGMERGEAETAPGAGAGAGAGAEAGAEDTRSNRPQSAWKSRYRRPHFTAAEDSSDDDIDTELEILDLDNPPSSPVFTMSGSYADPLLSDSGVGWSGDHSYDIYGDSTNTTITQVNIQKALHDNDDTAKRELENYMRANMPDELVNDLPYGNSKSRGKRQAFHSPDSGDTLPSPSEVPGPADHILPEVVYSKAAERVVEKYRRRAEGDTSDVKASRPAPMDSLSSSPPSQGLLPRKLKPILHRRSTSKDKIGEAMARASRDELSLVNRSGLTNGASVSKPSRRKSTPSLESDSYNAEDIVNASISVPHGKLAPLMKKHSPNEENRRFSDRDVRKAREEPNKISKQKLQPLPVKKTDVASSSTSGTKPGKPSPRSPSRSLNIGGRGEEVQVSDLTSFEARLDVELRDFGVAHKRHAPLRKTSSGGSVGAASMYQPPSAQSPRTVSPSWRHAPAPPPSHGPARKLSGDRLSDKPPPSRPSYKTHSRHLSDSQVTSPTSSRRSLNIRDYDDSPRPRALSYGTRPSLDATPENNSKFEHTPHNNRKVEGISREDTFGFNTDLGESPRPFGHISDRSEKAQNDRVGVVPQAKGHGARLDHDPPRNRPNGTAVPLAKSLGSSDFKMRQGEMMAQMMAELGAAPAYGQRTSGRHRDDDI